MNPPAEVFLGLPTLHSTYIDAGDHAGRLKPCFRGVGRIDVLSQGLAIFAADHSSLARGC